VNGEILLTPFMVVGVWVQRRQANVRAAGAYAAVLFLFMTFAFPFACSRGGLPLSTALTLLLCALAAAGHWFRCRLIALPALGDRSDPSDAEFHCCPARRRAYAMGFRREGGILGAGQSFRRNQTTYFEAARILRAKGGAADGRGWRSSGVLLGGRMAGDTHPER
jgi:hypothetical protein